MNNKRPFRVLVLLELIVASGLARRVLLPITRQSLHGASRLRARPQSNSLAIICTTTDGASALLVTFVHKDCTALSAAILCQFIYEFVQHEPSWAWSHDIIVLRGHFSWSATTMKLSTHSLKCPTWTAWVHWRALISKISRGNTLDNRGRLVRPWSESSQSTSIYP